MQQGKIQGWLTRTELNALGTSMRQFPGDADHADGRSRLAYMNACYGA
ncbi:hypothetical protein U1707_08920 [Sphingomonas sp. PB2P12]